MENLSQYKILLVDDVKMNIRTLVETLHEEYELYVVLNGESAIEHARRYLPDIILLDIVMPGMDGFEVCRRLKKYPVTADIPIIFLTALTELEDKTTGFEAGAVDYITKPFDPLEVRARVRTHLDLRYAHERLKKINEHLRDEIMERRQTEAALQKASNELERRVEERTAELMESNEQLRHEIDEHKRTLGSLRASEERYRLLTENVADGVCIIQDEKLVFINPAFATIFAYPEESLLGKDLVFMIRDDHKALFRDIHKELEKGARVKDFQIPCIRGDDREVWAEGHYNVIRWEGEPAILGTVRDVTQRRLKEIARAEERAHLLREIADLRANVKNCYKFGNIIGKSPAIREIYKRIAEIADFDDDVIIFGESGTGKELIARTIHSLSSRQNNAFVPINCGAIPEALFENEFFGHRKGAFTGADADKPGFFDLANNGTLFLDEVGELTLNMQVKLLRAVEGAGYTPVGDTEVRKTDVRIISATNRDLTDALKKGTVREDFFYRIHIIPIHVPPLRNRKEDISLLIDHFLKLHNSGKNIRSLPGNILEALYNHSWPGNVRELKNVLKRYLTLNCLDFITSDEASSSENIFHGEKMLLNEAVAAFEKDFISRALERNRGHRSETAKMLGITERTLYRKLK
ncbi:sigma 54-interacting transcriptional regulator [Desulfobacterales bacterium HSG2]|nr:sigma 54-interacting transcriptional regulator [Desulfobacterales bacterium HSG2]